MVFTQLALSLPECQAWQTQQNNNVTSIPVKVQLVNVAYQLDPNSVLIVAFSIGETSGDGQDCDFVAVDYTFHV
jgi:hypothetical protein